MTIYPATKLTEGEKKPMEDERIGDALVLRRVNSIKPSNQGSILDARADRLLTK